MLSVGAAHGPDRFPMLVAPAHAIDDMPPNFAPHVYVTATLVAVALSFGYFVAVPTGTAWYLVPVLLLALLYGGLNFARQLRGEPLYTVRRIAPGALLRAALVRYVVWLAVLLTGWKLLQLIPFYQSGRYALNTPFYETLVWIYIVAGLPYFLVTLTLRASRIEDYYDPALRVLMLVRQPLLRLLRGDAFGKCLRVFRNRYNRKVLLNLLMRAYFIPAIVVQVPWMMDAAVQWFNYVRGGNGDLFAVLMVVTSLLWLIDVTNAGLAYLVESRWLENRARSVDMTVSGWAVCLFCYEPLNIITGTYIPFAPFVVTPDAAALVAPNADLLVAVKLAEVALLALHIYVDVSLGLSVANITLRKLQTRGLYGVVRHPGTTTKLLFWILISACYSAFWTAPMLLGMLGWATLYILRALTEERHLRQYAEYRAYMQQVPYRFIPRVI